MPLLDFLAAYDVNPKLVAVAINGDVIPKTAYAAAIVRDGDDARDRPHGRRRRA